MNELDICLMMICNDVNFCSIYNNLFVFLFYRDVFDYTAPSTSFSSSSLTFIQYLCDLNVAIPIASHLLLFRIS